MPAVVLSHFNAEKGPRVVIKIPDTLHDEKIKQVPGLMDLYHKGFFIHLLGSYRCANRIFELPSKYARRKNELIMVSLLIDETYEFNFEFTEKILNTFEKEFKEIPDAYKAFYLLSIDFKGDQETYGKVWSFMYEFYTHLPEENLIIRPKDAKVFIYGLENAGKTTIVRNLEGSLSKNPIPTTNVNISRLFVNDLSLITYDAPGHTKFRELWMPYLKDLKALVFVLDLSNPERFNEANEVLHRIASFPKTQNLPLLILLNKVDACPVNEAAIWDEFELQRFDDRPFKVFQISGLTNQGIPEAFDWLTKTLNEAVIPPPNIDIGLIFAKYDQEKGIKLINVYPSEAFGDPEIIAMRCFSISEFIFGGEQFRRLSIILPFAHMNSNAAIYFDYLYDEEIRGGLLPLILIVFYNETIPRSVINQFNLKIFDQFSEIKKNYLDAEYVQTHLKSLHHLIQDRIKNFKTTVEALKIAELRYQSLFMAATDAILIIDSKSGIIIDANAQAEKLFQMRQEQLIGLHSSQLELADKTILLKHLILRLLNYKTPQLVTFKNSRGEEVPAEINANEVQMGAQNLIQIIIRDISERKLIEEQLKQSEIKYRTIFENSPFAVVLFNREGVIKEANSAFEHLIGYKKNEFINKKFERDSKFHSNFLVKLLQDIRHTIQTNESPIIEQEFTTKNGESRTAKFQLYPINIEKEPYILFIAEDVSEEKKIRKKIQNRIEFEKIIAQIASRFVIIKDFDTAINLSLKDIANLSHAKRASLFVINHTKKIIEKAYEWHSPEINFKDSEKRSQLNLFDFSNLLIHLEQDPFLKISADILSDFSERERQFLNNLEIGTVVIHAIMVEKKIGGFLIFEGIEEPERWQKKEISFLGIFSKVVGTALERDLSGELLSESELAYHKAYDRENFHKNLFIKDMTSILRDMERFTELCLDDKKAEQKEFEYLLNLKEEIEKGLSIIAQLDTLSTLEDKKIEKKTVEVYKILNEAIKTTNSEFGNKILNIVYKSKERRYFIYANDFLLIAFENIIQNILKFNTSQTVEIEIKISDTLLNDKYFLKIEFNDVGEYREEKTLNIDNKKEMFFSKRNEGILISLLLIEEIIDLLDGKLVVNENNFTVYLPISHEYEFREV